MEEDSNDIEISDLESGSDSGSDGSELWVDFNNDLASFSSSSSVININSSISSSTTPCLQSPSNNFTSFLDNLSSEHNGTFDKNSNGDRIKDLKDKVGPAMDKTNTDDTKQDSNLLEEMSNLFDTEQEENHKQVDLVKRIVSDTLKRLENVGKESEKIHEKLLKGARSVESEELSVLDGEELSALDGEELSALAENFKKVNAALKVQNPPVTDSSNANAALAQALAALVTSEEVSELTAADIAALTPAALAIYMEMMLAVLDTQDKDKITVTSGTAFLESATSKYSDLAKIKKLSLLLSESQTTQSDSKAEDVLAKFKTKSEYGSIGLVSPPTKKLISGMRMSKYDVDEVVHVLSEVQAKIDADDFAASVGAVGQLVFPVFPVNVNFDSEEEASDEQEINGSSPSYSVEQLSLTTTSTSEHCAYQADESSSEIESVSYTRQTVLSELEVETKKSYREELVIPQQPPLLYEELVVCASKIFPTSSFLFDEHCLIKTTPSSDGYQLYAKLCGQDIIIIFPRNGTFPFDRKQLQAYLQSVQCGAELRRYLAGIGLDILRHDHHAVINFEYLSPLVQLLVLYSLDSHTDILSEANPVDVLAEDQKDSFINLPVRVRSDDEVQGDRTVTTPVQNHRNRQSVQAVVEMFPFPTRHNSNSVENDSRSQGSDFCQSSSSGQRFKSGSASPNEGNERWELLHDCQDFHRRYQDEMYQSWLQELSRSYPQDQWEQLLRELCQSCRDFGFPEPFICELETASPEDFHRLTVCKCEQQDTIDMGGMVASPTVLHAHAGCDPDPDFPGPDRSCDIVQYFPPPDRSAIHLTLHQPNTEDNAGDVESKCETDPLPSPSGDGDYNHITSSTDEQEEKFHLA